MESEALLGLKAKCKPSLAGEFCAKLVTTAAAAGIWNNILTNVKIDPKRVRRSEQGIDLVLRLFHDA
jgi:hypothetical protein